MKKYISVLLLAFLCLAAFCGCSKTQCNHDWKTIGTHDHEIVVEVCTKCDETRSRPFTEEDDDHGHDHDHDNSGSSAVVPSVPNSKFPAAPSVFIAYSPNTAVNGWMGTYSWTVVGTDGEGKGVNADSSHPLDCLDDIEVLKVSDGATVYLIFEGTPTGITVKRYNADATNYDEYEEIKVDGNTFVASAGDYLYEVIASWNEEGKSYSGTVHYAFRTEK